MRATEVTGQNEEKKETEEEEKEKKGEEKKENWRGTGGKIEGSTRGPLTLGFSSQKCNRV